MVPMVPYCPDLIATCVEVFAPTTCSVNGSLLRLVVSPEAIRDMMCCPIFEGTKVFSKSSIKEFWSTKRDALTFYQSTLNRSLSSGLPKFPLSYSDLRQKDLKDISSTLSWLCDHDNDWDIRIVMMGFLFKCRKQRELFHFDFFAAISRDVVKKLSEFQQLRHFRFSSVLVHLLLYQNEAFFGQFMRLAICDESENRMSVSCWTPLLLASYDSYHFLNLFMTPVLKDLVVIPNEPLAHFVPGSNELDVEWTSLLRLVLGSWLFFHLSAWFL